MALCTPDHLRLHRDPQRPLSRHPVLAWVTSQVPGCRYELWALAPDEWRIVHIWDEWIDGYW